MIGHFAESKNTVVLSKTTHFSIKWLSLNLLVWAWICGGVLDLKATDLTQKLIDRGFIRHSEDQSIRPNLSVNQRLRVESEAVRPFAAVVTSSELGNAPEILLDQGLGDLSVVRIGGYFAADSVVASLEEIVENEHVPQILLLGREGCSVWEGAISGKTSPGHRGVLFKRIRMAHGIAASTDSNTISIGDHVSLSTKLILEKSPKLRKWVKEGKLSFSGAVVDKEGKNLRWLDQAQGLEQTLALPDSLIRKEPVIIPSKEPPYKEKETSNVAQLEKENGILEVRAHESKPGKRVLQLAKSGNLRFAAGKMHNRPWTQEGGHSRVVVYSAAHSKMPVEYILDASINDLYLVKSATLDLKPTVLASIEFGIANVEPDLVLILDESTHTEDKEATIGGIAEELVERSPYIQNLIKHNKITIAGGLYSGKTGKIDWIDDLIENHKSSPITEKPTLTPSIKLTLSPKPEGYTPKKDKKEKSSQAPKDVLVELQNGNKRFTKDNVKHALNKQFSGSSGKEWFQKVEPWVTVLAPSDLTIPLPTIFDQNPGSFFEVKVVGSVADKAAVSSLELGIQQFQSSVLIFLSHDQCIATHAFIDHDSSSDFLKPVFEKIESTIKNQDLAHDSIELIKANLMQSMVDTLKQSKSIREKFHRGELDFIGAIYRHETGKIEWVRPGQN